MNRVLFGLVATLLAGSVLGCGSGEPQATEEQKRDPAWFRAQLKTIDKEASIKPTAPKK